MCKLLEGLRSHYEFNAFKYDTRTINSLDSNEKKKFKKKSMKIYCKCKNNFNVSNVQKHLMIEQKIKISNKKLNSYLSFFFLKHSEYISIYGKLVT